MRGNNPGCEFVSFGAAAAYVQLDERLAGDPSAPLLAEGASHGTPLALRVALAIIRDHSKRSVALGRFSRLSTGSPGPATGTPPAAGHRVEPLGLEIERCTSATGVAPGPAQPPYTFIHVMARRLAAP
jgi:hypothetical protein